MFSPQIKIAITLLLLFSFVKVDFLMSDFFFFSELDIISQEALRSDTPGRRWSVESAVSGGKRPRPF